MIYLFFILSLLALFVLSQTLSKFLSIAFYKLFKNQKITIYFLAVLFFPGVVIHELSHWLMAQILFVPTGRVEFMPQLRGNELKLGSVAIAQVDPIRRALVGVAPFLFGITIILTLLFFYDKISIPESIKLYVIGYSIFEIGNTMFSSRKDLEGTVELLLTLLIVSIILFFIGIRIPESWIDYFQSDAILDLMRQATYFVGIPVLIDIITISILYIFIRLGR